MRDPEGYHEQRDISSFYSPPYNINLIARKARRSLPSNLGFVDRSRRMTPEKEVPNERNDLEEFVSSREAKLLVRRNTHDIQRVAQHKRKRLAHAPHSRTDS